MTLPTTHLAHTRQQPRGLFIDRWGTLLATPPRGYARRPSEIEFLPGSLDALFQASRLGWKIYLIGNEDAVAFGQLGDPAWEKIQARILSMLADYGVPVQRSYACLDHLNGKPPHNHPSVFRLPETGVFFHALHNDGIQLEKSWVIGDSTVELTAGWRADMRTIGVRTGEAVCDDSLHVTPDLTAADLAAALACLSRAQAEAA